MKTKALLLLRLIAAAILLQTLFFKFTGAPESKFIFGTLGVEPWGRIFSGAVELVASICLLVSATQIIGALIAISVMSGAILSHLFILGIVIQNDGGLLFSLACGVFFSCLAVVLLQLDKVSLLVSRVKRCVK
jgi:hypothetical protein